jgi:hypothetical protein
MAIAREISARDGDAPAVAELERQLAAYLALHQQVRTLNGAGSYDDAVRLAITREADALGTANRSFKDVITRATQRLDEHAASAASALAPAPFVVLALGVLGIAAALLGLRRRLREYTA